MTLPPEAREGRRPGTGTPVDGLEEELVPAGGCCWGRCCEKTKAGIESVKIKRRDKARKENFFTTVSPLEPIYIYADRRCDELHCCNTNGCKRTGQGCVLTRLLPPYVLDHSNANTSSAAAALARTEYRISSQSFVGAESEREG